MEGRKNKIKGGEKGKKEERNESVCGFSHTPNLLVFFFFFFLFFFLTFQDHTWGIWKFPGQGPKRSCSCQPQPHQIRATSATYTTAHGNARSLTNEQGQGLNPHPHRYQLGLFSLSQICQRFKCRWEKLEQVGGVGGACFWHVHCSLEHIPTHRQLGSE